MRLLLSASRALNCCPLNGPNGLVGSARIYCEWDERESDLLEVHQEVVVGVLDKKVVCDAPMIGAPVVVPVAIPGVVMGSPVVAVVVVCSETVRHPAPWSL